MALFVALTITKRVRIVSALAAALVWSAAFPATNWVVFRSGPFEVYTASDQKAAKDALNHLEQFRHTFGTLLGKQELETVWPVRVVMRGKKESPLSQPFFYQLAETFIEDNAGRMAPEFEAGIATLFSTLEVQRTIVTLGAPPPEGQRTRDWARVHMLSVDPRYSGKLRVLVGNFQRGVAPDAAWKNAFETTEAAIEKELDAYIKAGKYETTRLNAKAISAQTEFTPRTASEPAADGPRELAMAVLKGGDFKKAAELNPKWAEPWAAMAEAEKLPAKNIEYWQKAAKLAPRNAGYWKQLALAQSAQQMFVEAGKAWAAADRAAVDPKERELIHAAKLSLDQVRLDAEAAERKRIADAKQAELDKLRDDALAKIREAESKANAGAAPRDPNRKLTEWWDGPKADKKTAGTLERVDCKGPQATLVVKAGAKVERFLVRDAGKIAIVGGGEKTFSCGAQKPPRRIVVEHMANGDAVQIEFPQ